MGIAEGKVEDYLRHEVKAHSGYCLKLTGYKGIPDRLILLPNKPAIFCEVKAKDGELSPAQIVMLNTLRRAGFQARVFYSKQCIDTFFCSIYGEEEEQQ